MPYAYPTRVAGSNFEPLVLELRQEGVLLPTLGVEVTLTVKDQATGEIIVDKAAGKTKLNPDGVTTVDGRFEYYFTLRQVTCVCRTSTWLVQWTIAIGNFRYVTENATLIVRKPL